MAVAPLSPHIKDKIHAYVDEMFGSENRSLAEALSQVPFDVLDCGDGNQHGPQRCDRDEYRHRVERALLARAWFNMYRPAWAPELPLDLLQCHALAGDPDPRMYLVAHYAVALRDAGWTEEFPSFLDWAREFLLTKSTPSILRRDPVLKAEFLTPRPVCTSNNVIPFPKWR